MKTFSVRCSFTDRQLGPGTGRTILVDAGNIAGAIGKASREWFKGATRAERFDAGKNGLKIEAVRNEETREGEVGQKTATIPN